MATKQFSEQEKQELKNRYADTGLRQLSKEFGTTVENLKVVLTDMGVALRGRGRPAMKAGISKRSGEVELLDDSLFDTDNQEESDSDEDLPTATRNFFELNND